MLRPTCYLYAPARNVKVARKPFAEGLYPKRAGRVLTGPSAEDRAFAAQMFARDADASDEEWAYELDRRTMSRLDYLAARSDEAAARLDRFMRTHEAEVAETCGSFVGHRA